MDTTTVETKKFEILDTKLDSIWAEIFQKSKLIKEIQSGSIDIKMYAMYMFETYHYTLHNSRNQALTGVKCFDKPPHYLRYCFEHALEETGHELMALHDVKSLGLKDNSFSIPNPLPETEVLIGYLYHVSSTGNAVRRLGYSYWAENAYKYIMPLIEKIKGLYNLKDNQLTFFMAHSDIDDEHFKEVKEMIEKYCVTEQDWKDVEEVMETTLRLTANMLDGVYNEYQKLVSNKSNKYNFLFALDNN